MNCTVRVAFERSSIVLYYGYFHVSWKMFIWISFQIWTHYACELIIIKEKCINRLSDHVLPWQKDAGYMLQSYWWIRYLIRWQKGFLTLSKSKHIICGLSWRFKEWRQTNSSSITQTPYLAKWCCCKCLTILNRG